MTTAKPEWAPEKDYELDYEHMVRSWGFTVLSFDTCGSYQGDHCVLLADGERRGFTMIGYGSCTGCDELEGIRPYDWTTDEGSPDWGPVIDLSERLKAGVHWEPSSTALAEWLESMLVSEGKGTDWFWYDDDVKAVTRRYVTYLREASRA